MKKAENSKKPASSQSTNSKTIENKSKSKVAEKTAAAPEMQRPRSSVQVQDQEKIQPPIELGLKNLIATVYEETSGSSKWPLVIDNESETVSSFLRHRDANTINCFDKEAVEPEKFRILLLSSLRYGKPFVIDFMDSSKTLLDILKKTCNEIHSSLFDDLFSKKLVKEECFMYLVKESDGDNFKLYQFVDDALKMFKVIVLVNNETSIHADLISLTQQYKLA